MANVYRDYNSRQDSGSYGFQIYMFKVEIDCCARCPVILKKKLEDLDGIESVLVDESRNLASVKATINSGKIIKKIKQWGKTAELVHERKETNTNGYNVELVDEEEKEEDRFNSFHKNTSFRHKNSPHRHTTSSSRTRDKNNTSTHAPEKYDYSERNAYAAKEVPDHMCHDKYCTFHRRDNNEPNMNYGAGYPPLFRGGLNYNYPPMSSFVPPPPPPHGQYYDPEMVPPGPWYGCYAEHSNGCSIM